jgi:hypothetical protein
MLACDLSDHTTAAPRDFGEGWGAWRLLEKLGLLKTNRFYQAWYDYWRAR